MLSSGVETGRRKTCRLAQRGMRGGCRQRRQIAFAVLTGGQFTSGVEHRIRHRADMRVNSPEVAQHIEVKRGGLDGFGPAFTQTVEMTLGGVELGVAQK